MEEEITPPRVTVEEWTRDFSVLWRDGNWMKIFPTESMSEIEKANAIARLGLIGGGTLSILFRSVVFVGLGMLLLLLSNQMLQRKAPQGTLETGGQVRKRKKRRSRRTVNVTPGASAQKLEYPQQIVAPQEPKQAGGWKSFFGGPEEGGDAMGAYVNMASGGPHTNAAPGHQQEISQIPPGEGPGEGSVDENLVPASDVYEFQSGAYTMRTPFPRPMTAGPDAIHSQSTILRNADGSIMNGPKGPWAASYPYQTGFPTEFGPTPTAIPPTTGQFVRNVPGRPHAQQEATFESELRQPRSGEFQPGEGPVTWGAFMSDGGHTSTPLTVPVPSGTVGSNFSTNEYTPRNLAQAGAALIPPGGDCFPPDQNNLLGNPPVQLNRVARPKLCSPVDPRSDSEKFVEGLYESPSTQAAGYNFFPFPVQDVVEARDNFQDWVVSSGLTHFKDKYSYPEGENGVFNIVDSISELGY